MEGKKLWMCLMGKAEALIIRQLVRTERNNLASIYLVSLVPNPSAFSYPFVSSI